MTDVGRARPRWVGMVVLAALFCAPLAVMIAGSLRAPGLAPPRGLELIPADPSLESYRAAFSLVPLARALANSFIVAVVSVPLALVCASWAGLAIAQAPPRARRRLVVVVLLLLMVPVTALWIPRFVIFERFGVLDTFIPLIAPGLIGGNPFFVLLYVVAFRRIPRDTFDAARLDGANWLSIWRRIAMPLVRPTTVAVGMLAFILSWSDFISPLLYLQSESNFTAPLALRSLEQLGRTSFPTLLAASVVVTAPVAVIFIVSQRSFLSQERGLGWLGR